MNLVLHVTPLLWRNALIINPLHALLKFSNLIRSLQYINAFSTKAFFSPSEYFMTFNGSLFNWSDYYLKSFCISGLSVFDLLISALFITSSDILLFHFCSNLSFNWWSVPRYKWNYLTGEILFSGASQRLELVIKCCLFLSFFQCLVSRAPLSAVTKSLS